MQLFFIPDPQREEAVRGYPQGEVCGLQLDILHWWSNQFRCELKLFPLDLQAWFILSCSFSYVPPLCHSRGTVCQVLNLGKTSLVKDSCAKLRTIVLTILNPNVLST